MNRKIRRKIKRSSLIIATAIASGTALAGTGMTVVSPFAVYADEAGASANGGDFDTLDTKDADNSDVDDKAQNDENAEAADKATQDDEKDLGGGGESVPAYVGVKIVDNNGNVIQNALLDVTYTYFDSENTDRLGVQNQGAIY